MVLRCQLTCILFYRALRHLQLNNLFTPQDAASAELATKLVALVLGPCRSAEPFPVVARQSIRHSNSCRPFPSHCMPALSFSLHSGVSSPPTTLPHHAIVQLAHSYPIPTHFSHSNCMPALSFSSHAGPSFSSHGGVSSAPTPQLSQLQQEISFI